jgi:N-acetylglucosamine kinase-like BadF-type ATPase
VSSPPPAWIVGVDVGASGARARAVRDGGAVEVEHGGAVATPAGAGAAVVAVLERLAERLPPGGVAAIAVGATGLGTMAPEHGALRARIRAVLHAEAVALAADAVIAHVGALGGGSGATVAAGTGAIGIAQDADGGLRRSDGWGHLLGDEGSAAWIGQRGLVAAAQQFDGRRSDAPALLGAAIERFGEPSTWPRALYGRDDRAAVMGAFAPWIDDLAEEGDPVATGILDAAAEALAATARSCLRGSVAPLVARTGSVFRSRTVREGFDARLSDAATVVAAAGSPLDGAVALAARAAASGPGADAPGLLTW